MRRVDAHGMNVKPFHAMPSRYVGSGTNMHTAHAMELLSFKFTSHDYYYAFNYTYLLHSKIEKHFF